MSTTGSSRIGWRQGAGEQRRMRREQPLLPDDGPAQEAMAYGQAQTQQEAWRSRPAAGWIDRTSHADDDCPPARASGGRGRQNGRVQAIARQAAMLAVRSAPGFLLSFADIVGMPSGFQTAYVLAAGCCGADVLPPLVGCLAAAAMRMVWQLPAYWALLLCAVLALPAARLVRGQGNLWIIAAGFGCMLPLIVWGMLYGTAQETLLCLASAVLCALTAPVLLRAVNAVEGGLCFDTLELRVSVGWLLGLLVCGSSRMLLVQVNVGMLLAALFTGGMAMYCGVTAGMAAGLCTGLLLALMGLSPMLSVSLALGGLLCGLTHGVGRRWISALAFASALLTAMMISGATGMGCAYAAAGASALMLCLFGAPEKAARRFFHRFLKATPAQGDTYASVALDQWQQTMSEMAAAVPSPRQERGARGEAWWREHLCADCPDAAECTAMASAAAVKRTEEIWQQRGEDDEAWQRQLEGLRGLGCGRLYCLRAGMDHLRTEAAISDSWVRRACYQRDMLVTHLEAMAGAAQRFSQLSACESWWDEAVTERLRQRISETALPVKVMYVRRIQGHAAAALAVQQSGAAQAAAEDAVRLCSEVLGTPMRLESLMEERLLLREKPQYHVAIGLSGVGMQPGSVTGDAACTCLLPDGRLMAALSDGMGQGSRAGEESGLTVNLLRLCMQAGYTRTQTLTAVNGMMLLETGGERFATADLVTVDLWNGEATLDKLGAAGSWLMRGSTLAELTGDALPIGILETIESRSSILRLRPGDRMLLMTDGVEDAFAGREQLKEAIGRALREPYAQDAAELLLRAAAEADGCEHPDDRTVLVLQVEKAT